MLEKINDKNIKNTTRYIVIKSSHAVEVYLSMKYTVTLILSQFLWLAE